MQKIRLGRGAVYPACKSNRQIGICYSLLFLKTIISPTIPTIIPIIANGKSLKLANTVRFISALLALKSIPNRITAIPFNLLSFILFISITFDLFIRFPVYHTISWLKSLILIRKASPNGAASFVIYKERNHKTSLIWTPIKIFSKDFNWSSVWHPGMKHGTIVAHTTMYLRRLPWILRNGKSPKSPGRRRSWKRRATSSAGTPQRPAQSAAVPHGKGGEPEILQSGDRSGLLRISDEHTDQGGSRRFCRDAEQTLRGIQGGKPGRLFPLSVHCSGTMPVRENS